MAVSKIRKISSTSLLILVILTVVVIGLFFLGGYVDETAALKEPVHTDTLFYLMYVALGVTLLAMLYFAVVGMVNNLRDPKRRRNALGGLLVVVALAALLFITYAIGGTERLSLSVDFQQYNTDGYLKFTDMWLYSIYFVLGLNIIALIVFAIKGSTNRKPAKSSSDTQK